MRLQVAIVAWLVACGGNAAAAPREGVDALQLVVGNTIVVTSVPGGDRVMYIGKDGTMRGLIGGQPESGRWTFAEGKVCFMKGSGGRPECGLLKVDGAAGTFTIDGRDVAFTLKPGDAVGGATAGPPLAPGAALTGAKAVAAIIGNTIEGSPEAGGLTTVYVRKDGTARLRNGENRVDGKWSSQDGTMCIEAGGRKDCFAVEIDGTKVMLRNADPKLPLLVFTLLAGNARGL